MLPGEELLSSRGRQLGLHVAASITSTQKNLEAKACSPGKPGRGGGCAIKVHTYTHTSFGSSFWLSISHSPRSLNIPGTVAF